MCPVFSLIRECYRPFDFMHVELLSRNMADLGVDRTTVVKITKLT